MKIRFFQTRNPHLPQHPHVKAIRAVM